MKELALLAIVIWPLITLFLLSAYGFTRGSILAFLLAYLVLPVGMSIGLPGFPDLDKNSVTPLTILLYMLTTGKGIALDGLLKKHKVMFFILLITPLITAITNGDRYANISGLSLYDGISGSISFLLQVVPFLIGAKYIRDEKQHLILFKYVAISSIIYCCLALIEVRLSPQLHNSLYGYFPHSWRQQIREGGFRPVIFLGHGLVVALFIAIGFAFITTLNKAKIKILSVPMGILLAFAGVTLILCKTYSALGYGLFLFLAIKMLRPSKLILPATALASIFMVYPVLKMANLFPEQTIVTSFATLSEERASSLAFRFDNENMMLDHAKDKLLFGWGSWGRNRVYDNETGEDLTVIDGYWISIFGAYGFVGFVSIFFFFVTPIFLTYKNYKRFNLIDKPISRVLIPAHTLILSVILIDQVINSSLASGAFYWFLSGALYGRVSAMIKESQTKT